MLYHRAPEAQLDYLRSALAIAARAARDALNQCFSPSDAEIADAERIVAAYDEAERAGRGSTSLDGRVIDVPVVKRARALLHLAGR